MQDFQSHENQDQMPQAGNKVSFASPHKLNCETCILIVFVRILKGLCCAISVTWLVLVLLGTVLCFTGQLEPIGKAIVATTSVAAVIPILLLLNGKRKYLLGLPCLFVAVWIVTVLWITRDERSVGSQIGKQVDLRLNEIGVALHRYSNCWGHLPFSIRYAADGQSADWHNQNGNGKPLYGWRVEILTLPCSWNPSQSWDTKSNREVLPEWPLYSYRLRESDETRFPDTMVKAITGPGTAFGDGKQLPAVLDSVPPDTILVVETHLSGIPWPAPGDFDIRSMPRTIGAIDGSGISSIFPFGFHVLFADNQVWFLSSRIPFETLEKFFTIKGASNSDREELLGPYVLGRYP